MLHSEYLAAIKELRIKGGNMKWQIKHRYNKTILFEMEAEFFRQAVEEAVKTGADLSGADLYRANLSGANLSDTKNLVKIMGVEPGNFYWKRFEEGLCNNNYQFYIGLNTLRKGEVFASDDRVVCSHPGFHFASRSWCAVNYPNRPLEAKIRIPDDAQINEPWATDGKASADKIEILQVFEIRTGKDVTDDYRKTVKKGKKK